MKIGVPKESADGERRVALVPDVAKSLQAKVSEKIDPVVEAGAGTAQPYDLVLGKAVGDRER